MRPVISTVLEVAGACLLVAGVWVLADIGWALIVAGTTGLVFGVAAGNGEA